MRKAREGELRGNGEFAELKPGKKASSKRAFSIGGGEIRGRGIHGAGKASQRGPSKRKNIDGGKSAKKQS